MAIACDIAFGLAAFLAAAYQLTELRRRLRGAGSGIWITVATLQVVAACLVFLIIGSGSSDPANYVQALGIAGYGVVGLLVVLVPAILLPLARSGIRWPLVAADLAGIAWCASVRFVQPSPWPLMAAAVTFGFAACCVLAVGARPFDRRLNVGHG